MRKKSICVIIAVTIMAVAGLSMILPLEKEETVLQESETVYHDSDDRQIIISMGKTPNTLFLSWKGTEKGPGFLRVSQDEKSLPKAVAIEAYPEKALKGEYYRYTAELNGLAGGETYYYEIGDGMIFDKPRSFIAPKEDKTSTFLYLGDVQFEDSLRDYEQWGKMTREIYSSHPDIEWAMIGGDMVNVPGEIDQWNSFLGNCQLFSKIPLMSVSGNHEGLSSNNTYKKLFAFPDNGTGMDALKEDFYYFDYGDCRFIMTNSSFLANERKENMGYKNWIAYEAAVEKWLRDTVETSPKAWNIVVTHHPPYGMHDWDTVSPQLRKLWVPIMEEAGVDLVFCGHQHMYMRTEQINGITYVMGNSGKRESEFYNGSNAPDYCMSVYADGANYQVIKADPKHLQIISYNEKGLIIDEASLQKESWLHVFKFLRSH